MIAFLSEAPLPLPLVVDAPPVTVADGYGTITPITEDFERGAVLLKNTVGEVFRLSWNEGGDMVDDELSPRALPAGDYKLVSYRVLRDEGADAWHISSTGASIRDVEVEAGTNVEIELDTSIRISSRMSGARASMMISGENRAGLSIYRNGQRLPITYAVRDADGEELLSGKMSYG